MEKIIVVFLVDSKSTRKMKLNVLRKEKYIFLDFPLYIL